MITIKQIESPVVVTDGVTDVNLYAGQTYTCEVPEVNEWFEIEVLIDSSLTFNLGLSIGSSVTVDWESNGVLDYITDITGYSDPRCIKTYLTQGLKIIRVKGSGKFRIYSGGDNLKVTRLLNWGVFNHSTFNQSFRLCSNMIIESADYLRINEDFRTSFFGSKVGDIKLTGAYVGSMDNAFSGSDFNANIGNIDLRKCTNMVNFANSVTTWSTANYNASLMGWLRMEAGDTAPPTGWVLKSNVSFHGGSSVATGDGLVARNYLINVLNWTITDSTP